MRILITGSNGFIGRHLWYALKDHELIAFDREHSYDYLRDVLQNVDFIFHLAAEIKSNFQSNIELTKFIIDNVKDYPPIIFTSTTQTGTEYAHNKAEVEKLLADYPRKYIYRLSNVFGRWAKPDHNSAVATFIFNVKHGKELTINDPDKVLRLIYIDDLINEFVRLPYHNVNSQYRNFERVYEITVGELAEVIKTFKINPELHKKLFDTFNS